MHFAARDAAAAVVVVDDVLPFVQADRLVSTPNTKTWRERVCNKKKII